MLVLLPLLTQAFAAPITQYDPGEHDLYTYDARATPSDPATPIGYNRSVLPQGYDLTGVNIRDRRFNNASPYVGASTDINDYNSGYVAIVMVTPMHALVSSHYIGAVPSQMDSVTFMAEDGSTVVMEGVARQVVGPDLDLITFADPLPKGSGIATYSTFIDISTLPTPATIYGVDSQGRLLRRHAVPWWHQFNEEWTYTHEPFNYADDHLGIIFSGDSGTPLFISDYTNQTYFLGTAYDADMKIGPGVVARMNSVTRWDGYTLRMIDYPYCPADFDLDGQVTSADLSLLLAAYGTDDEVTDMNEDGIVDGADFGAFLAYWN